MKARKQFFEDGKKSSLVNDNNKWELNSWKVLTADCISQR